MAADPSPLAATQCPFVRPFAGLRPAAGRAAEVAAPPYDVLNDDEARAYVEGKPFSFLHISKPVIDCAEGTSPYDDVVYAKGRANLEAMHREQLLQRDEAPCYYVYRMRSDGHVQTGIAAAASLAAYHDGRIKRHELTQPKKEDDRVRQIEVLDAQTGPVIMTHHPHERLKQLLAGITASRAPEAEVALEAVTHELWLVDEPEKIAELSDCFGDGPQCIDSLYIADGHHRSAAASRVAARRQADNPAHSGDEAYAYFLTVLFPSDEVRILSYNRLVRDLAGHTEASFLDAVRQRFQVTASDTPVAPQRNDECGMYLSGNWYRLQLDGEAATDPIGSLAISILHDHLIEPLLDVADPSRDPRIDFVGGSRGLAELERRVQSGEMKVGFSLKATAMAELMAVADTSGIMPTKSTWFDPKLADGLISHVIA